MTLLYTVSIEVTSPCYDVKWYHGHYTCIQNIIKRWLLFFKVSGQRSRSYCHIVGKRCRQDTEWTVSSIFIQLCTIHQHDERKMLIAIKVGRQSSRAYCHIVGKSDRSRYVVGRIQTEPKAPGSYNWSPW